MIRNLASIRGNGSNVKDSREALEKLLKVIATRFSHDRCPQMAASLTFTTLLSVVPLLTIALTLFSAFPVFSDLATQLKKFVMENMLPATGGKMVSFYLAQFTDSAAHLTAFGLLFLGLTAMMMMLSIDHALNTIWHVSRPRTLMQRVLIYWLVLTLGPLLVGGSLSLTTWLVGISVGYAKQITGLGLAALKVTPIMLTTPAFIFLFRVVPNRYVPVRHAVIGGVVSAVAFESMNSFFALYLAHFPTYKLVYGAFASIPIFLLWVYLSWSTVLLGAVVASSLSHWRSVENQQPDALSQLYYALCMIRMMRKGLRSGRVQTLPMFSERLHVGFDYLEQILARLSRANLVSKLAGQGWSLIRDPDLIRLSELQRLFMSDASSIVVHHEDGGLGEWLRRETQKDKNASDISLQELFSRAGGGHEEDRPEGTFRAAINALYSRS